MNLTPEDRTIGRENFYRVMSTRRDFLKGGLAAGAVSGAGLGAMYFKYGTSVGKPLRVGVIGTGDEGSVLIGAMTPDYLDVVAISDIRPYNLHRAFHGDHTNDKTATVRPGLIKRFDHKTEDAARRHVQVHIDYRDLLNDKDVEAVIIALPLHLHAPVAIEAMRKGKHVLTEKLMAHSVRECKEMARVAKATRKILAVGHQRHYSILYENAVDTIKRNLLGEIHSIRAQWHRAADTWMAPMPDDAMVATIAKAELALKTAEGSAAEKLVKQIAQLQAQYEDRKLDATKYGYQYAVLQPMKERSALEELIRWRLWNRTGGGLMAELGSHQLDASGIFCTAVRNDGHKSLPLSVNAMGGRYLSMDRDCEDHVYCMYEYPGAKYATDPNNKIGVTYSSINGNGFGDYGEIVMGTTGTLVLDKEQEVMIFQANTTKTSVGVKDDPKLGPVLDTTASGGGEATAARHAMERGPVSRGYTEEMEHWAYCVRQRQKDPKSKQRPFCHPEVALADAVIALTTNIAMRENRRIEFNPQWFKIDNDETPEGDKPRPEIYAKV